MEKNKYYLMMENEIDNQIPEIEDDLKEFAHHLLDTIPGYFYMVPASSSGKFHPVNDQGEGGLVRHSISVKRMLVHLLLPVGYYNFTPRQQRLLQVAALFHDSFKSGTQEEYEENIHTKFLHPVLAANHILMESVKMRFDYDSASFIASAIMSHMGQWNTSWREAGALPLPKTPAQKALHLADYLASRTDINMDIPDPYKPDSDSATTTDEQENKKESN